MTVRQVETKLGVSYVVAAGIVSYLAKSGKATIVEKVFHESGKGKPTRVYEIDENVSLDLVGAGDLMVVKKVETPVVDEATPVEAVAATENVETTDVSEAA